MFSLGSRAAFPPWASELLGLPVLRGEYFYLSLVGQGGLIFFVLKYSILSVPCRNFHILVYCAKILVRYRYMLHENEANQLITCRFSKFLIQLCKKKRFLWGFVLKYYFLGGSCRNITVPRYWASEVLCRALFRGCAEILVLRRNIHLWARTFSCQQLLGTRKAGDDFFYQLKNNFSKKHLH